MRLATTTMDKKRLEDYQKKLLARREELLKSIARTEEEGRAADDDPTVDLADKAANSYTKEFLFGQNNTDRTTLQLIEQALERIKKGTYGVCAHLRNRTAAEAPGSGALGAPLHRLPGKAGTGTALDRSAARRLLLPRSAARHVMAGALQLLPFALLSRAAPCGLTPLPARGVRLRRDFARLAGGSARRILFPAPCRICGRTLDDASRIPICRRLPATRLFPGPCPCARAAAGRSFPARR